MAGHCPTEWREAWGCTSQQCRQQRRVQMSVQFPRPTDDEQEWCGTASPKPVSCACVLRGYECNHVSGNHGRISPLTFSLTFRLAIVSPGASVSIVIGPPIAAWKLTRSGAGEVNVWETAPDTMDCVGARGDAVYGPAEGGRATAGAANSGGPLADAAAREGDGEDTGTPMLAGGVIRTEETAEEREVTLAGSAAGTAPAAAPVTRIK